MRIVRMGASRGTSIWLACLVTGSLSLPATSQDQPRGVVRVKPTASPTSTTTITSPTTYINEEKLTVPMMASSIMSKPVPLNAAIVPSTETTLRSSTSMTSTTSWPSPAASEGSSSALPTLGFSVPGASPILTTLTLSALSATTSMLRNKVTADETETNELPLTSTSTATATATDAATITSGSSSTTNTLPIESSSRIASSAHDTGFPSSRKSTTSLGEITTTTASVSAKETRESPGKIRPQIKLTTNYTSVSETGVRLPEGASAALAKPTKYHYYPHNQHIYLLPECAVQQVCNAVYVRLNFTQPLCACPGRYRDPCSASLDSDDLHTTELVTDPRTKALTLVKTCEPVAEMRECRTPRDWSLLALQNVRTGKSHYLVICRCPDANILEGPMSHDQPTYASVPGIRVYGMMCVQGYRRGRPLRYRRNILGAGDEKLNGDAMSTTNETDIGEDADLRFPWHKVQQFTNSVLWD